MPYITLVDYITKYGAKEVYQLTLDRQSGSLSESDLEDMAEGTLSPTADFDDVEAFFEEARDMADATINSYIAARISLPIADADVPLVIKQKSYVLTRYELHAKRVTDKVQSDYDNCIMWLRDLAKGVVNVALDSDDDTTAQVGGPQIQDRDELPSRVFPTKAQQSSYISSPEI